MQKKVLLLHGWGGSDYPHWQSWLAAELAKNYGKIHFLEFSNYNFPQLELWKKELYDELNSFQPDIVICHSLANTLWFHMVDNIKEVPKLYLVAPPSFTCDIQELQEFFPLPLPTKTAAKQSILVSSTNDPYMDITEAKRLQESLNIPMKTVENGGHINADSGHGEWAWILEEVQKDFRKLS